MGGDTKAYFFRPETWAFYKTSGSVNLPLLFLLSLTCLFAVLTQFSSFGVISHASPVTYQVSSRLKAVVIVISGYLLFGETQGVSVRNGVGVGMSMFGIAWYTWEKVLKGRGTG